MFRCTDQMRASPKLWHCPVGAVEGKPRPKLWHCPVGAVEGKPRPKLSHCPVGAVEGKPRPKLSHCPVGAVETLELFRLEDNSFGHNENIISLFLIPLLSRMHAAHYLRD
jgi:hypothetical protein